VIVSVVVVEVLIVVVGSPELTASLLTPATAGGAAGTFPAPGAVLVAAGAGTEGVGA
jgi:hypothetical protein